MLLAPKESVAIQLKGQHQYQFAGYYAAVEKGFYADEGLDVILRELPSGQNSVARVLVGDAEYGVTDTGLLLYRDQGSPVVLLSQIFQLSSLVIIARKDSGISSVSDLAGKKVMFDSVTGSDIAVSAILLDAIGDLPGIDILPMSYDFEDPVSGRADAMSAYATSLPFLLRERGVDISVIRPWNYGAEFPGDNLFTTEGEIADHPGRAEKMIRATLRGWRYAIDNTDEIIELIRSEYNPLLSRERHRVRGSGNRTKNREAGRPEWPAGGLFQGSLGPEGIPKWPRRRDGNSRGR